MPPYLGRYKASGFVLMMIAICSLVKCPNLEKHWKYEISKCDCKWSYVRHFQAHVVPVRHRHLTRHIFYLTPECDLLVLIIMDKSAVAN